MFIFRQIGSIHFQAEEKKLGYYMLKWYHVHLERLFDILLDTLSVNRHITGGTKKPKTIISNFGGMEKKL